MIYSVKGELIHTEPGLAVIQCGGVGFKCFISMNTQRTLPRIGEEAMLYTYLSVREDALDLFGFATSGELNCYKMLTGISGVGPKVGLAILSELTPDELAASVMMGDKANITRARGVGPKAAERLVLELKDKFKGMSALQVNQSASMPRQGTASKSLEAMEALMALGFTQPEARHALNGLDLDAMTVEQAITQALKGFNQ